VWQPEWEAQQEGTADHCLAQSTRQANRELAVDHFVRTLPERHTVTNIRFNLHAMTVCQYGTVGMLNTYRNMFLYLQVGLVWNGASSMQDAWHA